MSISIQKLTDLNGDGKINGLDNYIAKGKGDVNGDGKIDWEDFFRDKGVKKDMNDDGKWTWQDFKLDRVTKALENAKKKGDEEKISFLEGLLSDNKITSKEMANFRGTTDDLSGDGKLNWFDNWINNKIKKNDNITKDNYMQELDLNNDGKIDLQDKLLSEGYLDYNHDGVVNRADKVYKETYGNISFGNLQSFLRNINMENLNYNVLYSNPPSPYPPKKEEATLLNKLMVAINHLQKVQHENHLNPFDRSPRFWGRENLQLGDKGPILDGNRFSLNEFMFLFNLDLFKLTY